MNSVYHPVEKKKSSRRNRTSIWSSTAESTANARYNVCDGTALAPVTMRQSQQNTCRNDLLRTMSRAVAVQDEKTGDEIDAPQPYGTRKYRRTAEGRILDKKHSV